MMKTKKTPTGVVRSEEKESKSNERHDPFRPIVSSDEMTWLW